MTAGVEVTSREELLDRASREALRFLVLDAADEELRGYVEHDGVPGVVPFVDEYERLEWRGTVVDLLKAALDADPDKGPARGTAGETNGPGQPLSSTARTMASTWGQSEQREPDERAAGQKPDEGLSELLRPCKECGEPKPLGQFTKHARTADGLSLMCRDCKSVKHRKASAKRVAKQTGARTGAADDTGTGGEAAEEPVTGSELLSRSGASSVDGGSKEAHARYCANGEECMGFGFTGEPTKLNRSNKGKVCFGCEERNRGRVSGA